MALSTIGLLQYLFSPPGWRPGVVPGGWAAGGGGGCIDSGSGGEVSGGGCEVFDHVGTAAHKSGVQGLVEDEASV